MIIPFGHQFTRIRTTSGKVVERKLKLNYKNGNQADS